ncbi:MAG: hypothetical protein Fur003_3290 [Candidatus Dojkabacteria bacterium]
MKVRITNLSPTSATVSWMTNKQDNGFVVYSKENKLSAIPSFWVPKELGLGYDDRDYAEAELRAYLKLGQEYTVEDVKVTKAGNFYLHHVTLKNLDPESTYYFRLSNGIFSWDLKKVNQAASKTEIPLAQKFEITTPKMDEAIGSPDPAYGQVYSLKTNGTVIFDNPSTDSIVYAYGRKVEGNVNSTILSSVTNLEGGWTIDKANFRDADGKLLTNYFEKGDDYLVTDVLFENIGVSGKKYHMWGVQDDPVENQYFNFVDEASLKDPVDEELSSSTSLVSKVFAKKAACGGAGQPSCVSMCAGSDRVAAQCGTPNCYCAADKDKAPGAEYVDIYKEVGDCRPAGCNSKSNDVGVCCKKNSDNTYEWVDAAADGSQTSCKNSNWSPVSIGETECKALVETPDPGDDGEGGSGGETPGGSSEDVCFNDMDKEVLCSDPSCVTGTGEGCTNNGGTGGTGGTGSETGKDLCFYKCDEVNKKVLVTTGKQGSPDSPFGDGYLLAINVEAANCKPENTYIKSLCPFPVATAACYIKRDTSGAVVAVALNKVDSTYAQYLGSAKCTVADINASESSTTNKCYLIVDDKDVILAGVYMPSTTAAPSSGGGITVYEYTSQLKGTTYAARKSECEAMSGKPYAPTYTPPSSKGVCCQTTSSQLFGTKQWKWFSNESSCGSNTEPYDFRAQTHEYNAGTGATKTDAEKKAKCEAVGNNFCIYKEGGYCKDPSGYGLSCDEVSKLPDLPNGKKWECNSKGVWESVWDTYKEWDSNRLKNACTSSPDAKANTCFVTTLDDTLYLCDMCEGDSSCPVYSGNLVRDGVGACEAAREVKVQAKTIDIDGLIMTVTAQSSIIKADAGNDYLVTFPNEGVYSLSFEGYTAENVTAVAGGKYYFYVDGNGVPGYQAPIDLNNPKVNEDRKVKMTGLQVTIAKTADLFDIELKKGINVISFNYYPTNEDVPLTASELLQKLNAKKMNVTSMTFFRNGAWDGGVVYDPKKATIKGNDFPIVFGQGYLLMSLNDVKKGDVKIPGRALESSVPVAMKAGWNLIGVNGYSQNFTAKSLAGSISSIDGLEVNNVTRWDTARSKYDGIGILGGSVYGFDYPILTNQGYFVRVSKFEPATASATSLIWHPGGAQNGEPGN